MASRLNGCHPARTAAQRKRDERDRRRAGEDIFRLSLPLSDVADTLIEFGELTEWDEQDHKAVSRALRRYLLGHFSSMSQRDMFEESDLLNSDHEINRDSAHAGKGKPHTR